MQAAIERLARSALRALLLCGLAAWLPAAAARADGVNNFLAGVNGLLTFPADPVMDAIHPPKQIQGLPGRYTEHLVGFASGLGFGVYRAWMGYVDIALSPLWFLPTLSPQAHWDLLPFYEIQYE